MIIFYYNRSKPEHKRLIHQLYASYPGHKVIEPSIRFSRNGRLNQRASCIVFAGMIRGEGLIYQWCKDSNKRFLFLDHAYLERGYNEHDPENEWMRITDSDFLWNKMSEESSYRWDKFFARKYEPAPWCGKRGNNILILPPSLATKFMFTDSRLWLQQTLRKLSEVTNRPIVIREKPIQAELNAINQPIKIIKNEHENSIEKELLDAYCILTYNSAVPVMANILGIPCITSQNAAAYPVSISVNQMDNPKEPPREKWLHQLVHHQYRTSEILNGDVWNMIFKDKGL